MVSFGWIWWWQCRVRRWALSGVAGAAAPSFWCHSSSQSGMESGTHRFWGIDSEMTRNPLPAAPGSTFPFLSDSGTCPGYSPWTPQTHPINDKCNNPGKGSSSKCWHPWGWSRGSCYPLSSCTEWMLTLSQLSWWAEKGRKVLLTSLRFGFKRFVSAQGSLSGSAGRGDGLGSICYS